MCLRLPPSFRLPPCRSARPALLPEKFFVELLLRASRLRFPVVAPFDARRQRHEDGLGAPARLKAKERAAVVDQVEFHVAPAPIGLERALALAVALVAPALRNRHVR